MENELVSIVMVNYNQEKFLKKAIDSVLIQTYKNWELIIVDDGSTDRSVDIIKEYEDDRIKPIFLQENSHICIATNTGFAAVNGKYIARLDSDDIWEKEKLEKQMDFMQQNPDAKVCFTQIELIDENGKNINDREPELLSLYNSRQKSREEWIKFFFFVGNSLLPTLVFEKKLLDIVGGFKLNYCQTHDFEFLIRLIKHTDFYFVEEELVKYRRTSAQNSASTVKKNTRFFNEYMDIRYHFFENMSDELFISAFKEFFHNKDASTHEEIVCEQAFLLEKCIGYSDDNPILGLFKLGELMNDEKYGRVLREKYNYTPKKYYEETCKKILWVKKDNEWKQELEKQKEDLKNKEEHIQKLLEIKELQQNHIIKVEQELEVFRQKLHAMEESRSWKMTQPIRKLKEKVRK
jgi:glycosyltransferase involved in cell wall biosynthesis